MSETLLGLENLKDGAAVEMLNDELQRVLANIQDVNTDSKQVRELNLKIKIKPSEGRFRVRPTVHHSYMAKNSGH